MFAGPAPQYFVSLPKRTGLLSREKPEKEDAFMRHRSLGLWVVGAVLSVFALAGKPAEPQADSLLSLRLLPPVLLKNERGWSLQERMKHYKVEGVSVAVIGDSRVLWEAAAGLADREERKAASPQTLFQAGSISKPVAATGVLRKAQDGAWAVGHDVNEYLKSWKLPENAFTS